MHRLTNILFTNITMFVKLQPWIEPMPYPNADVILFATKVQK